MLDVESPYLDLFLHLLRSYHSSKCFCLFYRAVFKWLSKVITRLRLLRLMTGLKDSRQFFSQWEAKPKPIAPCTRDFSRALSKFQIIAGKCDWFIALFAPFVIGRSNYFGFGFSTVIWKPLYLDLPFLNWMASSFILGNMIIQVWTFVELNKRNL